MKSISNFNLNNITPYILISFISLPSAYYLLYFKPVVYSKILHEDNWIEYGTAVFYIISGLLLFIISFRFGNRSQKIIWMLLALTAMFIGGEEISWGQRIFNFSTPYPLTKINYQNELSIHNMDTFYFIKRRLHYILGYSVIFWSVLSIIISIWLIKVTEWFLKVGLPLIPIKLIPIFLLVPYFLLAFPKISNVELGEFFLGLATFLWAFNLLFYLIWNNLHWSKSFVFIILLIAFTSVITGLLTHFFSRPPSKSHLNNIASTGYSLYGMYNQSIELYNYLYSIPEYFDSEMVSNYAQVLLNTGKQHEAHNIIKEALPKLEFMNVPTSEQVVHLRNIANIYLLIGQTEKGNQKFMEAIKIDNQNFNSHLDPNDKAITLWSISKTYEAKGDLVKAIEMATKAKSEATSQHLKVYIQWWIDKMNEERNN